MGQEVARDAAAGGGEVQAQTVPALGQVGGNRPVLKEHGPVVEDAAEPALVHQLLGQRDGRHAPVVVRDHVGDAGLLDRLDHFFTFGAVPG